MDKRLKQQLGVIIRQVVSEVLNHRELIPKEWLTEGQLHSYCGLSISFFRKARRRGDGPPFIRVNGTGRILYKKTDVDRWLEERGATSG